MGRPRKEAADRRTERIAVRLTPSERMQIEARARRADVAASEFVRLQALHGNVTMTTTRSLDHASFDQLRRIGVNLNQLTRIANQKQALPPELSRTLAALERLIARELGEQPPGPAAEFAAAAEPDKPEESTDEIWTAIPYDPGQNNGP